MGRYFILNEKGRKYIKKKKKYKVSFPSRLLCLPERERDKVSHLKGLLSLPSSPLFSLSPPSMLRFRFSSSSWPSFFFWGQRRSWGQRRLQNSPETSIPSWTLLSQPPLWLRERMGLRWILFSSRLCRTLAIAWRVSFPLWFISQTLIWA